MSNTTDTTPQNDDIAIRKVKWMIECGRCGGDGMVIDKEESQFEINGKNEFNLHTVFKKCPVCDGKGFLSEPMGPTIE